MHLDCSRLTNAVWILIGVYWAYASVGVKPVVRSEGAASKALRTLFMLLACFLLFSPLASFGALADRIVPASQWICWLGFGITVVGCGFAAWSRMFLGSNWSATVTLKQSHELIRSGPYAIVRHPIYAGLLLAVVGTAVGVGELRALAAVALALIGWYRKAGQEERFLLDQFSDTYPQYCRAVKRLIPFVL